MHKRLVCLVAAVGCVCALAVPGVAAEVESQSVYCFEEADFSALPLEGICVTRLPERGTVMLGTRVVRPGDIFTAGQLEQLTYLTPETEVDAVTTMGYLPIYDGRVEQQVELTIAIRGKENKAPDARDQSLETYKNIPNEGQLLASDPEGQQLVYTVTREPRRGEVVVNTDGSFVYTPKKNKVGVDSFTYTATDPAGKVSREATVTVRILKPSQSDHYTDTEGLDCRFEAEWLKNTGLFAAEQVGGSRVFQPQKAVSKGEFLVMLLKSLEIPVEDTGSWLQPYLDAARRSGLLSGSFDAEAPITGAEAAVWLQSTLELSATTAAGEELPAADLAMQVAREHGFRLPDGVMTRGETACVLYRAAELGRE